ncbi:DUF6527 family protein [Deinococcus ruber]|uniref:Uncharacterized protein n=1 Tax=Deinococcus ruber TaxID=1848197 RepID=A0A918KXI7_9DEIO|nr:DUF6527 family protein [Deinococcus ruber]GGR39772.1 hypothetical protein GCM10008957_55640 [Deinococcus ruber]
MPTEIDLKRTVRAVRNRIEGGLDGPDISQPGEMTPYIQMIDGALLPGGFTLFCPGCAERVSLPTAGPGPHWAATGDLDAGTLTLTPSIWHSNGCGWHGYLTNGVFSPV